MARLLVRRATIAFGLAFIPFAADRGARAADASDAATSCPDPRSVWANVARLVPDAFSELAPARQRLEVVDLGDRYRVRIVAGSGPVEREYVDPSRDCEKRARFAAEFVVLALMPPQLALETSPAAPPTGGSTASSPPVGGAPGPSTTGAPPAPGQATSAAPPAPPPAAPPSLPSTSAVGVANAKRRETGKGGAPDAPLVRLEGAGAFMAAPPWLGAPAIALWGVAAQVAVGRGRLALVAGGSYSPAQDFSVQGWTGALARETAGAGVRARISSWPVRLDADLRFAIAIDDYAGKSSHAPLSASRFSPGLEAGLSVAAPSFAGFAPFARAHAGWVPSQVQLVAPPLVLGESPAVWLGIAAGLAWTP